MNAFQVLTISALGLVFAAGFLARGHGRLGRRAWLLRSAVLIAAAVAIAKPDLVQRAAMLIGIGRGADVVLYLFVLFFIGTSFYFYSRTLDLQRQITELVRHLALDGAERGSAERSPGADGR